jgi:hypothetical protein
MIMMLFQYYPYRLAGDFSHTFSDETYLNEVCILPFRNVPNVHTAAILHGFEGNFQQGDEKHLVELLLTILQTLESLPKLKDLSLGDNPSESGEREAERR